MATLIAIAAIPLWGTTAPCHRCSGGKQFATVGDFQQRSMAQLDQAPWESRQKSISIATNLSGELRKFCDAVGYEKHRLESHQKCPAKFSSPTAGTYTTCGIRPEIKEIYMETKPSVPKAESNDNVKETLLSNDALEKIAGGETLEEFRQRVASAKNPAEQALIKGTVPIWQLQEWAKESKE